MFPVGDSIGMPRIFIPSEGIEKDLARALEIFSYPARVQILVETMSHGPLLRADLIERLHMDSVLVGRTLNALEDLGIITADLPRGARRGRSVKYRVHSESYEKYSALLIDYLASAGQPQAN